MLHENFSLGQKPARRSNKAALGGDSKGLEGDLRLTHVDVKNGYEKIFYIRVLQAAHDLHLGAQ